MSNFLIHRLYVILLHINVLKNKIQLLKTLLQLQYMHTIYMCTAAGMTVGLLAPRVTVYV